MATFRAINSFCESLMKYLDGIYPKALNKEVGATFDVISGGELDGLEKPEWTRVTLFLYRVKLNDALRNVPAPGKFPEERAVTVDLHFLVTVWAETPLGEHLLTGWVLRELLRRPVLDASILSSDGGWHAGETVQLLPEEISTEDLMRIWDGLRHSYRPSLPFVARGIRIDESDSDGAPVVAKRLGFKGRAGDRCG